jgi:tetratricopeptide (TPR) repeat protein
LASRAAAAIHSDADADALHGAALIDLIWADGRGIALGRSISYLESAAQHSRRPASVLADLAAASLIRAGETQNVLDLMEAIEDAQQSIALEPENATARYNLALALDWFGLTDEARDAWRNFVRVEPGTPWAVEAEQRIRELALQQPKIPGPESTADEVAAFVARSPQEARLLGWDEVLGQWGEALLTGNRGLARERLLFAARLGEALKRQGGDATLSDQVQFIRACASDPSETQRLAHVHKTYASARAAYRRGEYTSADTLLARVLSEASPALPLREWAAVFHGGTQMYVSGPERGEPLLRSVAERADTLRYPALAGRARWLLGTALLRETHYARALTEYQAAGRALLRAGEREHLGAVRSNMAVAERRLGLAATAYQSLHRALLELRPYRSSTWLHLALFAAEEMATADGFEGTTRHLLDEDAVVTARDGVPVYIAEARLTRARFLATAGDLRRARADVGAGRAAAASQQERLARPGF